MVEKLPTLRRVVRQTASPIVIDSETPLAQVARSLAEKPGATAVVVDASHTMRGTIALEDFIATSGESAETLAVPTPMLEPETDVATARLTMEENGVDRILVTDFDGKLLGIVTMADLAQCMI